MAIIKCKMCGGDLNIVEDSSVCECEYCGTRQTVPKADDEKKLKLFSRAGKLLRGCEFDKAAGVYESIVADFDEEAEAYWGLILCKYGIEYVDDPATGKKIPTCHRSSFESVEDDANFEQACENADAVARRVYREEARQIETLRKRILEVSGKEEPYDVFISYKELDEDGERTPDSVIAQDIYRALTKEGYRVFFSRISLEGKLGVEYEPYIFAALNSAKVMIVVGTDYEYYDAVWVKNEWSRFLKLIASGQMKTLIPVYKDMDPYDMPKELRGLAAQNMGKIGAMQDLLHGVDKLLGKKDAAPAQQVVQQTVVQGGGPNVEALLDRGNMALEDEEWEKAKGFFDQVLNMDSRNAEAYLGLAMAGAEKTGRDAFAAAYTAADSSLRKNPDRHLTRARRFGPEIERWCARLDAQGRKADEGPVLLPLKLLDIGDTLFFGKYPREKFKAAQDIEWLVLAKENDRLLVISRYALDCKPYNTEYEDTWESCSLRGWLNKEFFSTAFSDEEQALIPTVTVSADRNPTTRADPGKDTKDKVFLLSIKEAKKYFASDEARTCIPTTYAKANGCFVGDSGACLWWLRSPGKHADRAAAVNVGGSVNAYGSSVRDGRNAVRPALWIHLES